MIHALEPDDRALHGCFSRALGLLQREFQELSRNLAVRLGWREVSTRSRRPTMKEVAASPA